jgi:hypothetical protein
MRGVAPIHYDYAMRTPLRILAVVGALAGVVLGAVVLHGSFGLPMRVGPSAEGTVATPDDAGEDVVARALRLAAIDTTKKRQWVDDIPDLDLAALRPAGREVFTRIANGRACTCGCGFTLAGCRRFDSECEFSGPRASALYDSVQAGKLTRADGYPVKPQSR